jgi:hypothetical protein
MHNAALFLTHCQRRTCLGQEMQVTRKICTAIPILIEHGGADRRCGSAQYSPSSGQKVSRKAFEAVAWKGGKVGGFCLDFSVRSDDGTSTVCHFVTSHIPPPGFLFFFLIEVVALGQGERGTIKHHEQARTTLMW